MKSRKIGVLTMGLTLVAFGVMFLLRTFIDGLDYISVMRFWPVVLVGLGIEVLISALLPQKEGQPRAKVDALSIVVLFLTLFLAFGLATGQFVMEQISEHDWSWPWRSSIIISTSSVEEENEGLIIHVTTDVRSRYVSIDYMVNADGLADEGAEISISPGEPDMFVLVHRYTQERIAATTAMAGGGPTLITGRVDFPLRHGIQGFAEDFVLEYRVTASVLPDGDSEAQTRLFEGTIAF